MLVKDKDSLMKHAKHYKVRNLLKFIRLSLKIDRCKVAKSLHVSEDTIFNLENSATMKFPIAKPLLEGVCKLYCIDYNVINEKMTNEFKAYHRRD